MTCSNGGCSDKRHARSRRPTTTSSIFDDFDRDHHGDLYILIIDTSIKTLIFLFSVSLSDFMADCIRRDRQFYQREDLENYIDDSIHIIN